MHSDLRIVSQQVHRLETRACRSQHETANGRCHREIANEACTECRFLKSQSARTDIHEMRRSVGTLCAAAQPFVNERAMPSRESERGSSLVWALFFVTLTVGILVAHSLEMSANRKTMDTRYRRIDLAQSVAESGLTDAASYLRRQPSQPVVSFTPQRNLQSDPPVDDTMEPEVGLVREFEVNGSLWGRYEVRTDEAIDVSAAYGEAPGTVWDLGARGYLYERVDASRPFDKKPNRLLSTQTLRTEVRGITLRLPSLSALVVGDPDSLQILSNGSIEGGGSSAIAHLAKNDDDDDDDDKDKDDDKDEDDDEKDNDNSSRPAPSYGSSVTGSPASLPLAATKLDVTSVFGMREEQLRSVADLVVFSPKQLAGRVMQDQAVYVPNGLEIASDDHALRGRMLLAVKGDFIASEGNDSDFRGVLYVSGNAQIEGPFRFEGTMIVAGRVKIGGSDEEVRIRARPEIVSQLQNSLSQYRAGRDQRPAGGGDWMQENKKKD